MKYKYTNTCEEQHLQDQEDKLMTMLLCRYVVGQIITKDDGTREIVRHVSNVDGEYIVQTTVLTNLSGYYKVQADGSLKNGLSR